MGDRTCGAESLPCPKSPPRRGFDDELFELPEVGSIAASFLRSC